eukprot:7259249-Prymnesium_polylepis.1
MTAQRRGAQRCGSVRWTVERTLRDKMVLDACGRLGPVVGHREAKVRIDGRRMLSLRTGTGDGTGDVQRGRTEQAVWRMRQRGDAGGERF